MKHLNYEQLANYLYGRLSIRAKSICCLHLTICAKCRKKFLNFYADECFCREIRKLLNKKRETSRDDKLTWSGFKSIMKEGIFFEKPEILEETPDSITIVAPSGMGHWCYRVDDSAKLSFHAELLELPCDGFVSLAVCRFVELVNPLMIHYDDFVAVFSVQERSLVMDAKIVTPNYWPECGETAVRSFFPWFQRVYRLEITPEQAKQDAERQIFEIESIPSNEMPRYLRRILQQYFERFKVLILEDSPHVIVVLRNDQTLYYSLDSTHNGFHFGDTFNVWGTLAELPPNKKICGKMLAFLQQTKSFYESKNRGYVLMKFLKVDHALMVCAWPRTNKFLASAALNRTSNQVLSVLRNFGWYFEAPKRGNISLEEAVAYFHRDLS